MYTKNQRNATSVASAGGIVSASIQDLLKGFSGFEEHPGTETGHDYSCQVGPRAIGTNTRDDRPNFTSDVARRMHGIDDVMHHVHRSSSNAIRAVKSDADDDTDDDASSLSSRSSDQSS